MNEYNTLSEMVLNHKDTKLIDADTKLLFDWLSLDLHAKIEEALKRGEKATELRKAYMFVLDAREAFVSGRGDE